MRLILNWLLVACSLPLFAAPLEIHRITPDGTDVPTGRQIVIHFNRAVVPLGRMERKRSEIPITFKPEIKCQWRWIDTRSLGCQLDEKDALIEATEYQMTIRPGIQAQDGATLNQTYTHRFSTFTPKIGYVSFETWKGPGKPYIRVTFNQPVSKKSVEEFLFFKIKGERKVKATVERVTWERKPPRFIWMPTRKLFIDLGPQKSLKPDDMPIIKKDVARRVWLISPNTELPADSRVLLEVEPGIRSAFGPQLGTENRVVKQFNTFPKFEFLGVECQSIRGDKIFVDKRRSPTAKDRCNPLGTKALLFSSPVIKEAAEKSLVFKPDLAGGTDIKPWDAVYSNSQLWRPHQPGAQYRLNLPPYLKAFESYQVQGNLKDEFGRSLEEPIDITLLTDHRAPKVVLPHRNSVLEKGVDSELPIYVTNIDKLYFAYNRITAAGNKAKLKKTLTPGKEEDVAFAVPGEIRKLLRGKSGFVHGTLSSKPATDPKTFFSQVTPFQVSAKMGHYNTLVWVTDMRTGDVVKNAEVAIFRSRFSSLTGKQKLESTAKTDREGKVMLKGRLTLDPHLHVKTYYSPNEDEPHFFIRVRRGQDMALLPVLSTYHISPWNIGSSAWPVKRLEHGFTRTWGTTAQGIYRAGDTIQYKIYVRQEGNRTFQPTPLKKFELRIFDPMGKAVFEQKDLTLNSFGGFAGEFPIPKTAAVGWYSFEVSSPKADGMRWTAMSVLVTDFTPTPFKVTNSLNGDLFRAGDTVEVNSFAKLHSGGPYSDASVRVNASFKSTAFQTKHPHAKKFHVQTSWNKQGVINEIFGEVNDKGEFESEIELKEVPISYGRLSVESAVQDDRGKYIASTARAEYRGRDRYVGIHSPKWVHQKGQKSYIEYIVFDELGNPVRERASVKIEREKVTVSRVKGSGNAFLTHYNREWVEVGNCSDKTDKEGTRCYFTPEDPGSYRFTARVEDTDDRIHTSQIHSWVVGKGHVVWESENNNTLKVIPENEKLNIGDTARYLVKNPYPGAKALVSIERYGVIDSWVEELDGSTPIVEFKIKPDYLPGFYLSITVVSKRAADSKGFGKLDLGKPGYKMAYLTVPVKDPHKEILVSSKSDQEVYRPRDKVELSLQARARHPKKNAEPIELAVAVLDEAVFDLIVGGKANFDPYHGFYRLDSLDVLNYLTLSRILGRQKFEKKGANQGGGGGDGGPEVSMRNLFKFVAYWNPSIKTDNQGKAKLSFTLPDNLTGWRVLALAVTPSDRFGLGDSNFKTNRPTEIRPVMPNQLTEGDSFKAGFSVMNRTDQRREIEVTLQAQGNVKSKGTGLKYTKSLSLKPYKRETVWMPIKTTGIDRRREVAQGEVKFTVTAGDKVDKDGLLHTVPVRKRRSLLTAANYGTTTKKSIRENILFPKNIFSDVGAVSVTASPTVIGNAQGAFTYLRDYPYQCWEQRLTKGVMASHFLNLTEYLPPDLEWPEAKDYPKKMLADASGFQAPNGGMAYFIAQDSYVSPYLSAYTALAFNWLRDRGYRPPEQVENKLHEYLLNLLRRNAFPTFFHDGMSSTVRAVALAALAQRGKIKPSDIRRYEPHRDRMSLFGKALYLQAALKFKTTQKIARDTVKKLMSYSDQTGGKFQFREELDDGYTRILSSVLRSNCAILSAFSEYAKKPGGNKLVGDVPFRLVRFITQSRGSRTHFENTQENMFCLNGLIEYSNLYEKTKPKMTVQAFLNEKKFGETEFKSFRDKQVVFSRPIQPKDPGKTALVKIKRQGKGRLYYATRVQYAPQTKFDTRTNAGIDIRKEYSVERDGKWELLDDEVEIERGDLVRVDIYLSLPAARNYVVVDDPVPGGLEPLNSELANVSRVDANKGQYTASGGSFYLKYNDWYSYGFSRWSFYHREIRHHAVRFYSDYLSPGRYHLSYTAQAIATGEFAILPVHAEEMYDPDVFGKGVSRILEVEEK